MCEVGRFFFVSPSSCWVLTTYLHVTKSLALCFTMTHGVEFLNRTSQFKMKIVTGEEFYAELSKSFSGAERKGFSCSENN